MIELQEHYAWVKLVATDAKQVEYPPCDTEADGAVLKACNQLFFFSGHRPPRVAAVKPLPEGVEECCDLSIATRVLRSKVERHGRWAIDRAFGGVGGKPYNFHLIQFVGTRDEAIRWLSEGDGQRWREDAIDYFLIKRTLPVGLEGAAAASPAVVAARAQSSNASLSDVCRVFPEHGWRSDYAELVDKPSIFIEPEELQKIRLDDPGTNDPKQECDEIKSAMREQDARKKEILREAHTIKIAFSLIGEKLGDPSDPSNYKPATMQLIDVLIENLLGPIFFMKKRYNRARPYECCSIKTILVKSHEFFPAHPAYPSGHAVISYVLAEVFSLAFPKHASSFSDKAKRIAENRVAAGFHWPSDVTAGVVLAQALLKHVKMNETIKDLVAKAATEWPQR